MNKSGTVIIVTHNSAGTISDCLESLAISDDEISFLTIVVDNCSSDETVEIVERKFSDVHLIKSPENGGFAAGNNQGIAQSYGDWIFFLNPDATITPHTITLLSQQLKLSDSIGIIAPKIMDANGKVTISYFPFLTFWTSAWIALGLQRLLPVNKADGRWNFSKNPADQTIVVDRVIGAAMMANRRAITEIGGFDRIYFLFSEEEDLCQRLNRAGWKSLYFPGAEVRHIGGASMHESRSISIAAANWSRYLYLRKFHSEGVVELSRLIWIFGLLIRLLGALIIPHRLRRNGVVKGYILSLKSLLSPGYFDRVLRPKRFDVKSESRIV